MVFKFTVHELVDFLYVCFVILDIICRLLILLVLLTTQYLSLYFTVTGTGVKSAVLQEEQHI
jgi:hypothetical protein